MLECKFSLQIGLQVKKTLPSDVSFCQFYSKYCKLSLSKNMNSFLQILSISLRTIRGILHLLLNNKGKHCLLADGCLRTKTSW